MTCIQQAFTTSRTSAYSFYTRKIAPPFQKLNELLQKYIWKGYLEPYHQKYILPLEKKHWGLLIVGSSLSLGGGWVLLKLCGVATLPFIAALVTVVICRIFQHLKSHVKKVTNAPFKLTLKSPLLSFKSIKSLGEPVCLTKEERAKWDEFLNGNMNREDIKKIKNIL